jgi:hypothetical protein
VDKKKRGDWSALPNDGKSHKLVFGFGVSWGGVLAIFVFKNTGKFLKSEL